MTGPRGPGTQSTLIPVSGAPVSAKPSVNLVVACQNAAVPRYASRNAVFATASVALRNRARSFLLHAIQVSPAAAETSLPANLQEVLASVDDDEVGRARRQLIERMMRMDGLELDRPEVIAAAWR